MEEKKLQVEENAEKEIAAAEQIAAEGENIAADIADEGNAPKKLTKKQQFIQLLKFTLFSASAGIIQLLSTTLLHQWTGWLKDYYWLAYIIGLTLSVIWNFTFNRKFTFKAANNVPLAMVLVIIYNCLLVVPMALGGYKLERLLGPDLGIVVTVITLLINFVTEFFWDKFIVFNQKVTDKILNRVKRKSKNAEVIDQIPVIVGVTGHRNIVEEDKPEIKKQVIESLIKIKELCKSKKKKDGADTPVIMLNAFAQGADMLCAETAFELGIKVYAVLPCSEERYKQSFDLYQREAEKKGITSGKEYEEALAKDEADKKKLDDYLNKAERKFVAPDAEKNRQWFKTNINISDSSYEYRQLGIYIAEHSHILIALWDGKPPKDQFGCGTVEVIKFALEHNYLDKDHIFKPGMINDCAVVWIKSRRQGDGDGADIRRQWLISKLAEDEKGTPYSDDYLVCEDAPVFLENIISKTVAYNDKTVDFTDTSAKLWNDVEGLDDYRQTVRRHYIKANELSYNKNQSVYNKFVLALAIIGTIVACTFLIYDDASLPYMIFPCTVAVGLILWLTLWGNAKGYHKNYIEYRALAEALRIQFYMSMCISATERKEQEMNANVCDLYSWTQKADMIWIDKAIQSLAVISKSDKLKIDASEIIDVWIGNNDKPKGQLKYHSTKKQYNKKKAKFFENWSKALKIATVVIYFLIFAMEIAACILKGLNVDWFWQGNAFAHISCRNVAAMALGIATCGSLLFSSYWGKLSYARKADDNVKMSKFYASAYARWEEAKKHRGDEVEKFVKEIAREEIVENGIWCSYVSENGLEINI